MIYRLNLSLYNGNKSEKEKLAETELHHLIYGPGGLALAATTATSGDGSATPKVGTRSRHLGVKRRCPLGDSESPALGQTRLFFMRLSLAWPALICF